MRIIPRVLPPQQQPSAAILFSKKSILTKGRKPLRAATRVLNASFPTASSAFARCWVHGQNKTSALLRTVRNQGFHRVYSTKGLDPNSSSNFDVDALPLYQTPVTWYPIPIAVGALVLVAVQYRKRTCKEVHVDADPALVGPLLALIQSTTLLPAARAVTVPAHDIPLSALHCAALECLSNIFLAPRARATGLVQERRRAVWEVAAGVPGTDKQSASGKSSMRRSANSTTTRPHSDLRAQKFGFRGNSPVVRRQTMYSLRSKPVTCPWNFLRIDNFFFWPSLLGVAASPACSRTSEVRPGR
ncbi:hypothetical protein B0H11DRAFT_2391919 [Mycena galericulata]|nr:hypothetical protein B0H11DRAFT_2391919 [Mycena galericulata]